ncbi:hypothetical protein BH10CYA1_BH10CYA1_58170 [soil metagenome]
MQAQFDEKIRNDAADHAVRDLVWLVGGTTEDARASDHFDAVEEELSGAKLAELLDRNFTRLDPNGNGISRTEIAAALMTPNVFSVDEYAMLKLVAKYFDTIIKLSDDEEGDETVLTRTDAEVLSQFLVHSKLKLSELRRWIAIADGTATEQDIGPPPMSGK